MTFGSKSSAQPWNLPLSVTHKLSRPPPLPLLSCSSLKLRAFFLHFVVLVTAGARTWDSLFMEQTELCDGIANVERRLFSTDPRDSCALRCGVLHWRVKCSVPSKAQVFIPNQVLTGENSYPDEKITHCKRMQERRKLSAYSSKSWMLRLQDAGSTILPPSIET